MCNAVDDEGETAVIPLKPKFLSLNSAKCNKCREQRPNVLLRNKDAYCQPCFLHGTSHKFKGLLGKHRFVQPEETVLIVHNCGHPTTALLHLIRTGLNLGANKKLRFIPIVLYIENLHNFPSNDRQKILQSIETECKYFDFTSYFVSFSEYILNPLNLPHLLKTKAAALNMNCSTDAKVQDVLNSSNEKMKIILRQLIVDSGRIMKCKTIFTTDIAVDIGTQILTNVALGRGSQLPLDVGLCDTRETDIKIVRPLRYFEMKELAFYNIFHKLEPVCIPSAIEVIDKNCSVQNLMKKFVFNLQQNFPATITTIVRTCDKLSVNETIKSNNQCEFCKAPIEEPSNELTSDESTHFSHYVSTIQECLLEPDENLSATARYDKITGDFNIKKNSNYCICCNKIML